MRKLIIPALAAASLIATASAATADVIWPWWSWWPWCDWVWTGLDWTLVCY